ncbi:hypothetical protein NEOLEDRAFT_887477 [Neolentinus lepideus HHB14362 ss-1]|uniref:Uncharacterized protein n=1 Tax=Neolentinus lepideus HHB14362 ss-1 TaxID=1314782 RepID=A0A165NX97_9AGAM|nr:hypothetical protein NEOLEDRAFT_887477 [Neolentinus lepideus HHB14362 ss-1]
MDLLEHNVLSEKIQHESLASLMSKTKLSLSYLTDATTNAEKMQACTSHLAVVHEGAQCDALTGRHHGDPNLWDQIQASRVY